MPVKKLIRTSAQLFVCTILLTSSGLAQFSVTTPGASMVPETPLLQGSGINVNAFANVPAQPLRLRILFNIKAEEAAPEKAVERLLGQMEVITKELEKLSAVKGSVEFSDVQCGLSPITIGLQQSANANATNFNAMVPPAQFPQAFQAQVITAEPQAPLAREESYQVPKIFVATTAVSADWDIQDKTKLQITTLRFSLLRKIDEAKLNGKHLTHSYTSEEEDEIFERTKIDVRNPAMLAQWNQAAPNLEQSLRTVYIGKINEKEFDAALKDAFKTADKLAHQIAAANALSLGVIETANTYVVPAYTSSTPSYPSYPTFPAYSAYFASGYYSTTNSYAYITWEPPTKPNEIRLENLGQLLQKVDVFVRYKIK